jgi:acyl carrier protein
MDKLTAVFRDVFDRPDLEIDGLTRENFSEWDSFAHVKLIIALEEEFDVKFTIDKVANTNSVEELRKLLASFTIACK